MGNLEKSPENEAVGRNIDPPKWGGCVSTSNEFGHHLGLVLVLVLVVGDGRRRETLTAKRYRLNKYVHIFITILYFHFHKLFLCGPEH